MGANGAEYDLMIPWNVKKQKLNREHTEQCHGNITYHICRWKQFWFMCILAMTEKNI